jgi:hypothetical protein
MKLTIILDLLYRWGFLFLIWHVLNSYRLMPSLDGSPQSDGRGYVFTFMCALVGTIVLEWDRRKKKKESAT